MKHFLSDAEEVLNRHIGGFHQYILSGTPHLYTVSENFCALTGYAIDELLSDSEDLYASIVYPPDSGVYAAFLARLQAGAKSLTAEYRIVKKSGKILFVRDSAATEYLADGTLVCHSSLSDIGALKGENHNLRFLDETVPCGFLKYTCEKQPKITYINRRMMDLLHFPQGEEEAAECLELYRDNVFLLVPIEERRRFTLYLNRVYSAGKPVSGEMALQRCDGTRVYIFGWVTKTKDEKGREEFQCVCIDVTERRRAKQDETRKKYLKAISDVYDKIFEYDLSTGTVTCLRGNNSPMFRWMENISMQMEEATEKWITDTVVEEEREKVRTFFRDFCHKKFADGDGKPPQITYRAKSTSGEIRNYRGVIIKLDEFVSLYCLKCISDAEIEIIRKQNAALKENIQDILTRFTDGIAAFVVADGLIKPLYAGENVCEFFGCTQEEWLLLTQRGAPLKELVAKSDTDYEDFENLFRNGEGEFIYYDVKTESERRIKAVCSRKVTDESVPQYVMLYKAGEVEKAEGKERREVSIRMFGYFDVFVDGKAIAFRNKKSKELFALLADRRGGYVTSEEAIGYLWEDEPVNPVTLARYRKVALRLKNILEEYGIADVVETVEGKRRVVPEKVKCDLYDYLSGKAEHAQLFKGSYLTNYSWAENTLAELAGDFYAEKDLPRGN